MPPPWKLLFSILIPCQVATCPRLQKTSTYLLLRKALRLIFAFLSGTIPAAVFQLPSLSTLSIVENRLSGSLASTLKSPLSYLNLSDNTLTGIVPDWVCSVSSLDMTGNKFQCPVPTCCGYQGNAGCLPCTN